MSRIVRALAVAAVAVTTLFMIDAPAGASGGADQAVFVAQINSLRAGRGLPALAVNGGLIGAAQNWAAHLATVHVLAHNPDLVYQVPSGWRIVEENVGMGANDGIIESSFAASPDHYGNMVNGGITEVGVGVVSAGGYLWVVEDFWAGTTPPGAGAPVTPVGPGGAGGPAPVAARGYVPALGTNGAAGAGGGGGAGAAGAGAGVPAGSVAPVSGRSVLVPNNSATRQPAPSETAPAAGDPPADLNTVANQVQYFDTWN